MMLGAFALASCQTVDDGPVASSRSLYPSPQSKNIRAESHALGAAPGITRPSVAGATIIAGTGRFVGEPATGTVLTDDEDPEDGVILNLVNVSAPQAAKTILGDILAVRYTVDPGIEGKVTIQTPKPVTREAAIDLFQASLRSNGATIVNNNGQFRILPLEQAAIGAPMRVEESHGFRNKFESERIGSGLQVVQLKYVAAAEMRRVLEPIAPRGGIVRTDNARNLITLSGSNQEIGSMMEAIALFDIDTMQGMSFALPRRYPRRPL